MISVPLSTPAGSKKFNLNLNEYRNAHYKVIAKAKLNYANLIFSDVKRLPKFTPPIKITITFFAPNAKRRDLSNVCSIVDKFFCDELVKLKKLPDDDVTSIPKCVYLYGGIDRQNPRCEVEIEEL